MHQIELHFSHVWDNSIALTCIMSKSTHIIKEQIWGNVRFWCVHTAHGIFGVRNTHCTYLPIWEHAVAHLLFHILRLLHSVVRCKCRGNLTEIPNKLLLLLQHYDRNTHIAAQRTTAGQIFVANVKEKEKWCATGPIHPTGFVLANGRQMVEMSSIYVFCAKRKSIFRHSHRTSLLYPCDPCV